MALDAFTVAGVLRSLNIEQGVIERVLRVLDQNATGLGQARIHRLAMSPQAFGGSEKAAELQTHHHLAHYVIAETLLGVVADLQRFRDGVDIAVRLVDEADTTSAQTLDQKTRAVAVITEAAGTSEADERYDQARNDHVATQLASSPGGDNVSGGDG